MLVVGVCAVLAYWTFRPANPGSAAGSPRPTAGTSYARPRFVPVGTTRACTVPGHGPLWSQYRRVRRAMEEHRNRGWEPVHDPRPPVYGPDGWLLTFQKVR